jgi:phosphomannomutase
VQVRPSNTEPVVRVIAEAPRAEEAERLCREVGGLLR